MKTKIKQYKGVDLFYNEDNGKIYFEFEGVEREVKYIFEAQEVIDEPKWEECDMEGYFVDGYIDKYIGLAKAKRKDLKTGNPDWLLKGQYDLEYKRPQWSSSPREVFIKSEVNDEIYKEWDKQRDVYRAELNKLNNVVNKLSNKGMGNN